MSKDHFIDRPNTAIKATHTVAEKEYGTKYKEDFDKASRDFWKYNDPGKLDSYTMGEVLCKFGKSVKTLSDYLERVQNAISESIRDELKKKGKESSSLKIAFDNLENAMKLLARDAENLSKDLDINRIGALMHGFVNTYVGTQISESIKKERENETKR